MTIAALIIGIDEYAHAPLTSAVNDALAFRRALIDLDLVPQTNIQLLTAPLTDVSQGGATREVITKALYEFYDHGNQYERLYFFYAGHGLMAYRGVLDNLRNAIMPVDVENLSYQGNLLLDFDELRERLRFNGPGEQLFFIDACRNLDYERHPDVGNLGWQAKTVGPESCQSTLFAVAPMGKAEGQMGGLGRMTEALIKGLQSDILAVQYDEDKDQWITTMHSLSEYVATVLADAVKDQPIYKRKYMLPRLEERDPRPSAVRIIDPVGKVPFVIHIQPDHSAEQTEIKLSLRQHALQEYCLPPRQNHEEFLLLPQRYLLEASSRPGWTVEGKPRRAVDVRQVNEENFTLVPADPRQPAGTASTGPSFDSERQFVEPAISYDLGPESEIGWIRARSHEPVVMIEIERLDSPVQSWSSYHEVEIEAHPGSYRVRFRLGKDVFNETEFYVKGGERVQVEPTIALTSLVKEALGYDPYIPSTTQVSETIGDIQAGLLPLMLPIIGIKPFDLNGELFGLFYDLVDTRDPADFGMRPLSLVLAVDGNGWGMLPSEIGKRTKVRVRSQRSSHAQRQRGEALVPRPLKRASLHGPVNQVAQGLDRIHTALTTAPEDPFWVEISSPIFGQISIASASLINRATVVTLTLRPDGSFDISQNLLRLPGQDHLYYQEHSLYIPYGKMLRELQLGQQLYESGELLDAPHEGYAMELVYAKWTDPILGAMGYHAWHNVSEGRPNRGGVMETTASNMYQFFGELPDAQVVYGLQFERDRERVFQQMLTTGVSPILAESTRQLAHWAMTAGNSQSFIAEIARHIRAGQPWTVLVE
jgi:hypothetical protein